MTRMLLIPVAGTIAALAMIVYARQPRGETTQPELPPFDFQDAPEHAAPPDDEEPLPEEPAEEEPEPEKTPQEFQLRLEADGSLVNSETGKTYASTEQLAEALGAARHTLVITNGEGVERAKLDQIETSLRDRFKVVKVYRAPETPPAEER